jgi:hypothetical protein
MYINVCILKLLAIYKLAPVTMYVCMFFTGRAGRIFEVVKQLSVLASKRKDRQLVDHFLRWVRADAHTIHRQPQCTVWSTCR